MHRILCTIDGFSEKARAILADLGDIDVRSLSQDEFATAARPYTCLLVQLGLSVDRSVIDAAPNLKCIATATTGLDHIDVDYAASKGIEVLSLKSETEFLNSITATAELALGLLIALVRRIPSAHSSVTNGNWNRPAFCGHSLSGKTLGIVGFGRLGKMMARYGEALGMNVVFTDPREQGGIALEGLLKISDAVSLHVPLRKETEGMIGSEELQLMKPTAVLINTSRGKVVDEDAVIEALHKGTFAGYATDVLADELQFKPDHAESKLIDYAKTHDNVIITPHIGGTTVEAREATDVFIAHKVRGALENP